LKEDETSINKDKSAQSFLNEDTTVPRRKRRRSSHSDNELNRRRSQRHKFGTQLPPPKQEPRPNVIKNYGEKGVKKKKWRILKNPRKYQLLEAKDRFGNWTSAVIVNTKEINGENTVLVFYEGWGRGNQEWIPLTSKRFRPHCGLSSQRGELTDKVNSFRRKSDGTFVWIEQKLSQAEFED